jgi:hypothetical protein
MAGLGSDPGLRGNPREKSDGAGPATASPVRGTPSAFLYDLAAPALSIAAFISSGVTSLMCVANDHL